MMRVRCNDCGLEVEFNISQWQCHCGGAWEPANMPPFEESKIITDDFSIWRYGKLFGLDIEQPMKRMGVGWSPLVPIQLHDHKIFLKLEYLSPSGSFKDRGVNAMVNQLTSMGAKMLVEDSSGNAGASLAAHAARFGIKSQIFVPAYASVNKVSQIAVYGAEVIKIDGVRKDVEEAAQASVSSDKAYASHAHNPAYLVGQMSAAWELWEQLGRKVPDWIISPVAQGGQFLGYWFGFKSLLDSGLIDRLPRLVIVQSAKIAPIYHAWKRGMDWVPEVQVTESTVAEGVAISKPSRGKRILQVLYETDGRALAIEDSEIIEAQMILARKGFFVEPTSALAAAGFRALRLMIEDDDVVVIPLTGNGLKGKPKYQ
jgi:threonine synthase